MAKERIQDLSNFIGLRVFEDPSKAPQGSARTMVNMILSDRGGLKKRKGVSLLGSFNNTSARCRGFFVFKKTDSVTEIPVKKYDDELEYYDPGALSWSKLKDGFTTSSDFGFVHGFVRSGNNDYLHGGNQYEADFRWTGNTTLLDGAIASGAGAEIQVDSVLRPDVYANHQAAEINSTSATTIELSSVVWAANQWVGFYVYIKDGTHVDKIRPITANTNDTITFDTLGSDPGSVDFEIRYPLFAASGNLIIGGNSTVQPYTSLPEHNKFAVSSIAVTAADNAPVTEEIELFYENPRGNRMEVLRARRYVANVRSGLLRDSSGTLSGAAQPGSVFVSKVVSGLYPGNDLTDFTFSATRTAGEGDIIAGAYGGEGHTDIKAHDDEVYMFKPNSIESLSYSQDTSDVPNLKQISTQYGSKMQVIKGRDDLYFITSDKQFTSLGRVRQKAEKETALNIGLPVKRLLESYGYDKDAKGAAYRNRIHIPTKSKESDSNTNRLLIYNLDGRFEGEWWVSVDKMDLFGGELVASQSNSPNVVKLYQGLNDVLGESGDNTKAFPISTEYVTNWFNSTGSAFNQMELNLFLCEGYILGNTTLDFKLFRDFLDSPFLSFNFQGNEGTVDSEISERFLGSLPLGLDPIGAISSTPDNEGMRHFMFMVYFPFEHAEWAAWGVNCSGRDTNFEILRAGLNPKEDTILDFGNRLKTIT